MIYNLTKMGMHITRTIVFNISFNVPIYPKCTIIFASIQPFSEKSVMTEIVYIVKLQTL